MKKFMIRCDIEGVTGVVSYEQAEPGKPEYGFGQKMFMSDLLSLIKGLNAGGAEEIVVYDEHYYGRNVDLDTLPQNTSVICGKPPYRKDWAGGLDKSFTGLILLGFHSKYGTPGGLLPHSYELDIRDLRLNGLSVGEIGMEAAIAGDYDVPLLMVCADSAGTAEAEKLIPGLMCVAVKGSICSHGGLCLPAGLTSRNIYKSARRTANGKVNTKPLQIKGGAELEIDFNEGDYFDMFKDLHANDMTSGTYHIKGDTVTEVWSLYWKEKLLTQDLLIKSGK